MGMSYPTRPTHQTLHLLHFYLFRSMQQELAEQHFTSHQDIEKWLDEWIDSKEEKFFFWQNPFIARKIGHGHC